MKVKSLLFTIIILIGVIIYQWLNKPNVKSQMENVPLKETCDSLFGNKREIDEMHYPEGFIPTEFLYPKEGLITNYRTAIKIAESVWLEKFGKTIYKEKPFNALLVADSLWIITGSLPENTVGGSLYMEIGKKDGKIYKSIHEK